jgi:Uma2 family endonuclease
MSATAIIEAPALPEVPPVAAPAPLPKMTVEEYFAFERTQEIRYEYVEGELIAMPGTSYEHNEIAGNIYAFLKIAFKTNNCRVFIESIRLRTSPKKYRYPDVVALCAPPISDGENPPALLNPALAVEVLSSSTEATDKGTKLHEYQAVPSLTDYLLVSQENIWVLHCNKQNERQWTMTTYNDLAEMLTFESLGVTISLADIYEKIAFDAQT